MSQGDIRAGGGYVELYVRPKAFYDGLKQSVAAAANWSKRISVIGAGASAGLAAATIGLQGGIEALKVAAGNISILGLAKHFAEAGSALDDMAQRTGFAAGELSQLAYIGALNDFSLEDIQAAAKGMSKFTAEVLSGGKGANEMMRTMKISARQLAGATQYERFKLFLGVLEGFADPAQRAAAAMQIFGKSALSLMPTINAGADAFAEQIERAKELGLVMSDEDVRAAAELGDTFDELRAQTSGLANRMGAALAPAVRGMLRVVQNIIGPISKWITQNRALITALTPVIGQLGLVTAGLTVAAGAIALLGPLVPTIAALGATLVGVGIAARIVYRNFDQIRAVGSQAWRALANLATMAIDAMGDRVKAFIDWASGGFQTFADNANEAWRSITNALAAGDLLAAFRVVTAGIDVAWTATVETFRAGWQELTGIMERTGIEVAYGFMSVWESAFASVTQAGLDFGISMTGLWADFRSVGNSAIESVTSSLRQAGYQLEILKTAMYEGFGWVPKGTTTETIRAKFREDNEAAAAAKERSKSVQDQIARDRAKAETDYAERSAKTKADRDNRIADLDRNRDQERRANEAKRTANADASADRLKQAMDDYNEALKRAASAKPGKHATDPLSQTAYGALSALSDPSMTSAEKATTAGSFSGFGAAVGSVTKYDQQQAERLGQIHDVLRAIYAQGVL